MNKYNYMYNYSIKLTYLKLDDKKQDTQTNTIRELNLKIQKDDRINYSLLPLSDGLSFIQKK